MPYIESSGSHLLLGLPPVGEHDDARLPRCLTSA